MSVAPTIYDYLTWLSHMIHEYIHMKNWISQISDSNWYVKVSHKHTRQFLNNCFWLLMIERQTMFSSSWCATQSSPVDACGEMQAYWLITYNWMPSVLWCFLAAGRQSVGESRARGFTWADGVPAGLWLRYPAVLLDTAGLCRPWLWLWGGVPCHPWEVDIVLITALCTKST